MDSIPHPWGFHPFIPKFRPFWWPGNTKDFSSFAERKSRVIEAMPKAQASPLTPWGWLVEGVNPTPKKNVGEYRFNKIKQNRNGRIFGSTMCFFTRCVDFLDVCWLLGCVRYSLFKIPLLSKTSPLYPRHQT